MKVVSGVGLVAMRVRLRLQRDRMLIVTRSIAHSHSCNAVKADFDV